jgi:hypothetical protein
MGLVGFPTMGKASRRNTDRPARRKPAPFARRPFEGLPNETRWVAMRELLPSATATVSFEHGDFKGEVTLATVLPLAWAGMHRADGTIFAALQTTAASSGDPSRDLAAAILAAAAAEPGISVPSIEPSTAQTPRLQEILTAAEIDPQVHDDFGFWFAPNSELDAAAKNSLEQANAAISPTKQLGDSLYWTRIGERSYLRWVLPQDEDAATTALARLHAAGASTLGEDTRLLGAFRACGLLVPVWEVPDTAEPDAYQETFAALAGRFDEALANEAPLTAQERGARAGLVSRQVTIR